MKRVEVILMWPQRVSIAGNYAALTFKCADVFDPYLAG